MAATRGPARSKADLKPKALEGYAVGPITYHAAAYSTSYLSRPGSGNHTEDVAAYPYSTTSWFFLDAVDVLASSDTAVVCAFGDSITDGQFSTTNGNDRWPDALSDRLHAMYGNRVSVVNEGIAGNTVVNPPQAGDRSGRKSTVCG